MVKQKSFAGVTAACRPPTRKHRPLIWECMLGTVYALSPQGEARYFDYDWDAAIAFAKVARMGDLRVSKGTRDVSWVKTGRGGWPRKRQWALWGVMVLQPGERTDEYGALVTP